MLIALSMDSCNGLAAVLLIIASFEVDLTSAGVVDEDVIRHCCELGRAWTIQSQEICGPYPESYVALMLYGPAETLACTALVDACCVQARREKQCSAGRETAVVLGRCDGLHLYQANEDAKECCNCCHLGLITNEVGGPCRVPVELSFSPFCVESFTECCRGQAPVLPGGGPGPDRSLPLPAAHTTDDPLRLPSPPLLQPPEFTAGARGAAVPTATVPVHLDVCEQFEGELCAHVCVATVDSYFCRCRQGFTLQTDDKTCSPIADEIGSSDEETKEELELEESGGSVPGGLDGGTTPAPISLPPGRCRHGYAWNRITHQCEDIDECILELHSCDPLQQSCVNVDGDFQCLEEIDDGDDDDDGDGDDDRDTYDDYYPETDPLHHPTNTNATPTPTTITDTPTVTPSSRLVVLRSRPREDRPIFRPNFTARLAPPPTQFPGQGRSTMTHQRSSTSAAGQRSEEVVQCLAGYALNSRKTGCVDVDECLSDVHNCRLPNQVCGNAVGSFRCECEPGYSFNVEAIFCEDVDECEASSACSSDQLCENTLGSFLCSCADGYTMDARTQQCTDVNECRVSPNICGQTQQCQNVPGSYRCTKKALTCTEGYELNPSATRCIDIDECVFASSCADDEGQTVCENTPGSFRCSCETGFTLDSRSQLCTDVDECQQTPKVCSVAEDCENAVGSYRCRRRRAIACEPGFVLNAAATKCVDVDECRASESVCGAKQNCENIAGSYRCNCEETGHRLNASTGHCDDIDECLSRQQHTCLRGQTCFNTPGSYECRCDAGYTLDVRTKMCVDVDECEQSLRAPCDEDETCENTQGSYRCRQRAITCPPGFIVTASGRQCTDVDECALKTHNCGPARTCHNTAGSFRCALRQCAHGQRLDPETGQCNPVVCARGMRLDHAGTCTDINECSERLGGSVCRAHQNCRNTVGSYQCHNAVTCGSGYELNDDTGRCDDIDECVRGTHGCQGSLIECINRQGTYLCQCPEGYRLDHQRQSCEDIDECRLYRGHICSQNADCENSPGSYRCNCKEGFELMDDKRSCRDVDECLQPRLCQHNCHNSWGSFHCSCNSGYQLSSADARSCSDIDECTVWSQRGTVLCQGICENTPGSYRCSCPPGYQMGTDGRACKDVDECSTVDDFCAAVDAVCVNTRGGHKCQNVVCPRGFTKVTNSNRHSHAIRCQRKTFTCAQGDAECLYAPISYSVNFIAIPGRLIRVPADLFTMRGPMTTNRRLQFELQVVSSEDPRTGAVRANRAFFNLNQVRPNEVVVQLVHEISGAQDVQLQLNMNVYTRDPPDDGGSSDGGGEDEIFFGTAVAKIFIYITEDPW